jgi:adenosylcobinamide-GDP ribazoletransferase
MMPDLKMLRSELATAFMLLTRLPVARFAGWESPPDLARCAWAFPLAGLVVGGLGGAVYWAAHSLGMPPPLAAAWTLAATMAITGGLHEDGLADVADGFGGGATRERKLSIMRDSRIGTYGALALALSTLKRLAAIAALDRPGPVAAALIGAGMLGRGGIIMLLLALPPARADGLGASVRRPPAATAAAGFIIAAAGALAFLPFALPVILIALAAAFAMVRLAGRQIGGHTGDVLGAGELTVECAALTAIACFAGA